MTTSPRSFQPVKKAAVWRLLAIGIILGVEVTAGNVHGNVAWDIVYEQVTSRFPEIQYVTMDAGYKQPWIAQRILEDGRIPILPYTRPHGTRREGFLPWGFSYDEANDQLICPCGEPLRHTTNKDGKRIYRSTPEGLPELSLPGAIRRQGQGAVSSHLAGGARFSGTTAQNRAGERHIRHAQTGHRARRMQKKNTPCDIRTTEAWPASHNGSRLSLLL